MNKQIENYESKFITSKDYEKPNIDLHKKFREYYDKYIPKNIYISQSESDYDKIIAYCKSKDAKIHEILEVFIIYFENIPVNEMVDWMETHSKLGLIAYKSYYNARKYAKKFRR